MIHPYMNHAACVARLVEEYRKYGSIVVAFDFDNTVFDYHGKGHNYQEIIDLLKEAKAFNCHLIVFTAEEDTKKIVRFLRDIAVPFDAINENPPFFKSESRKIYFNILLDDRAGLEGAFQQLKDLFHIIKNKL